MSRGKQLKTKIKEAVTTATLVSMAVKVGEEKALAKLHANKPMLESLKEHISKMIDRIDPLEVVAVCSGTYIIHTAIVTTEDLFNKVTKLSFDNPAVRGISDFVTGNFSDIFNQILGAATQKPTGDAPLQIQVPDLLVWMISFFVAFLLVRWGGQFIASIASNPLALSGLLGLVGIV
jgi:hypothetical protein